MTDILYTYNNQVYANITNRCNCSCTFCIRGTQETVGDATNMWFEKDPTLEEIKAAIDAFDFTGYEELVYCGYGEPTCALENLLRSATYIKEKLGIRIRLNTNGLGNLQHGRDIIPELAAVVDCVSISLNAPTAEKYQAVTRPKFPDAFENMLAFAKRMQECLEQKSVEHLEKPGTQSDVHPVQLSIVDVLPEQEIDACKEIAKELGVYLKIRSFSQATTS